jgi:hypothetical protein
LKTTIDALPTASGLDGWHCHLEIQTAAVPQDEQLLYNEHHVPSVNVVLRE